MRFANQHADIQKINRPVFVSSLKIGLYTIKASLSHHGQRLKSGHYTARVLEGDSLVLRCNDASVDVANGPDGITGLLVPPDSYMLLLERDDSNQLQQPENNEAFVKLVSRGFSPGYDMDPRGQKALSNMVRIYQMALLRAVSYHLTYAFYV